MRHAGDILEDMAALFGERIGAAQTVIDLDYIPDNLNDDELAVLKFIDPVERIHADTLSMKTGMDASRLGALLLGMEFKGCIQRLPGDHYRRRTGGKDHMK